MSGYLIGENLRGEIRLLVDERRSRVAPGTPIRLEPRFEDMPQQRATFFRICTFTAAWSKNTEKTVTFKYITTSPNTVQATNLFAAIGTATGTRNCAIAKEGTAWFLIAAEC